ncbi:MAG: hypothetical protein AB7F19_00090 [Candidatus Babeliales bacterium]
MKAIHAVWGVTIVLPMLLITTENLKGELSGAVSKDRILMALTSNHTRVFSKDDLFGEPLSSQEWYRFLNELKKFVAAQGKGDQKLNGTLETILENNDLMVNTIKITYNSLFAKGGSYQEALFTSSMQKLQQVIDAMTAAQKSIAKETYLYKSKKEVRDVLEQVALVIELTAQKARNDLRAYKTKLDANNAKS